MHFSLLTLLFLLVSCASNVKVKTPGTFFITSETSGGLGEASLVFHQQSSTDSNFNFNNERVTEKLKLAINSDVFGLTTQLGLVNSVDFIYKTATHTPEMFGAKVQINGANHKDSQKGEHSLSVVFMGGSSRYETIDGSNIGFGSTSDINFRRTHTVIHFGLLYGVRLEDYWLVYTHLSEAKNSVHGVIDFEGSVLDGTQANFTGEVLNATFGTSLDSKNQKASFHVELTMQNIKWSYTPRETFYLLALGIGYRI